MVDSPQRCRGGQAMVEQRPSKLVIAIQVVALLTAIGVAILAAPQANWDLPLIGVLFAFTTISDLTAFPMPSRIKVSGSMISLILAMVILGGTPAALIGVGTILVGWLRWREAPHYFLNNLVTYIAFPLAGGIGFHAGSHGLGIEPTDASFYLLVLGIFFAVTVVNFSMIAAYGCYIERESFWKKVQTTLAPMWPAEMTTAVMAVGIVYIYDHVGITSVALFGVVLVTFQRLQGSLFLSEQRAEELESRGKQLVSFQVGMLSALMRTLDLRDEMTARHCASVARYCRAIAEKAGLSRDDQELVHIAGLLHDIGKFILPDHILKANVPLNDDDWNLIKMHPAQGAKVVESLDGYGPVAKIIMAHHERIDGKGYPRSLKGDEIPELSRIISVADTYDVMTARDSYKEPVSSFEAIQELQRVAGSQLDARFVKVFVEEVLEGKDLDYRHGADADFDFELALEERIAAVEKGAGFLVGVDQNGADKEKKHRDVTVGA
jgi:putative nucleotidyltransferase with HDIG domain